MRHNLSFTLPLCKNDDRMKEEIEVKRKKKGAAKRKRHEGTKMEMLREYKKTHAPENIFKVRVSVADRCGPASHSAGWQPI